jgi:hypothetical protein
LTQKETFIINNVSSHRLLLHRNASFSIFSNQLMKAPSFSGLITRNGPGTFPSGDEVRSVWNLDAKTIVVIDDVSSPNVLNFNTGDGVRGKLPRQFFTELQSRFGNQFYIAEEGNAKALTETVGALKECLGRENGCRWAGGSLLKDAEGPVWG